MVQDKLLETLHNSVQHICLLSWWVVNDLPFPSNSYANQRDLLCNLLVLLSIFLLYNIHVLFNIIQTETQKML